MTVFPVSAWTVRQISLCFDGRQTLAKPLKWRAALTQEPMFTPTPQHNNAFFNCVSSDFDIWDRFCLRSLWPEINYGDFVTWKKKPSKISQFPITFTETQILKSHGISARSISRYCGKHLSQWPNCLPFFWTMFICFRVMHWSISFLALSALLFIICISGSQLIFFKLMFCVGEREWKLILRYWG